MKWIFYMLFFQFSCAQNYFYKGKVLCQDLLEAPAIKIFDKHEILIATTDFYGNFEIKSDQLLDFILLQNVGYQNEKFILKPDCFNIEIIYLYSWDYDFVTLKTANRKLKKVRKNFLKNAFNEAYEKKIFKNEKFCELIYQ